MEGGEESVENVVIVVHTMHKATCKRHQYGTQRADSSILHEVGRVLDEKVTPSDTDGVHQH